MEKDFSESQFLADAKKNINDWFGYWGENNTNGQKDRDFLFQSQWDSAEVADNRALGKAQLQFNKLYDFYRRAIAEQRKNTVSLEIRATSNAKYLDQDTIDVHEMLLRGIAYDSKASEVYQSCFATQMHFGYGAIRVKGEWENDESFNQKIVLESFENPEYCFWDQNAKKHDKSDGDFCGVYTSYTKDAFKKAFPDVDPESISNVNVTQTNFAWVSQDTVTVAEYYFKEYYDEMLYLLANGETMFASEYRELQRMEEEAAQAGVMDDMLAQFSQQMSIEKKRKVKRVRIKSCVLSGNKIVSDIKEWPGNKLPIIYVDGDSYRDEHRQYTQTFIKHAKDAQRFLNYCKIEIATGIKNARREQWMVTPENIKGFEKMWKNPEKQQGALLTNVDSRGGLPQKMPPSELPQTLLHQYQQAELDLQSILGMYESARGAESNETSGVAIANRARQGQNAMFIYFDNLNRGIESVGRLVLDLMPVIYDSERTVMGLDKNGKSRELQINKYDRINDSYVNQIGDYHWDIEVSVGASFEQQKQEALQTLVELTRVSPETFPMVADLIAENIDLINTPQLVERFKNFVPPAVLAKEAGEEPPPPQPNPQEEMMQAQMQIEQEKVRIEQEKLQVEKLKADIEKIKAIGDLEQVSMDGEIAHIRAAAEIDKAQSELEKEQIKAFSDAVKLSQKLNSNGGQGPH